MRKDLGDLKFHFVEDSVHWWHDIYMSDDGPIDLRIEEARRRVLATLVEPLVSTDIDTVVYRLDEAYQFLLYDTRVGESSAEAVEIYNAWPFPHRLNADMGPQDTRGTWMQAENFRRFFEVGFDPFAAIIERLHEVGKQAFLKLRMNDMHVAAHWFDHATGRARATRFQLSHPEYMLGYRSSHYPSPSESALDYAHEEYRQHRLAIIEEIGERYDLDGLELNYCRGYRLFRDDEIEAGREHMIDFLGKAKTILHRIGERRGRPIKLVIRFHIDAPVQASQAMEFDRGLDVLRCIREGVVDAVVPVAPVASVEPDRHLPRFVDAARDTPCEVYAGARNCNHDDIARRPVTRELMRTAIGAWADCGVDGIYLWWPRVDPEHANWDMLKELRNTCAMNCGDKHYVVSEEVPVALQPGDNAIRFKVVDDLPRAAAEGRVEEVRLKMLISNLRPGDELEYRLNGRPIQPDAFLKPLAPSVWYVFGALTAVLRGDALPVRGRNELTVVVQARDPSSETAASELVLRSVELTARFAEGAGATTRCA